MKLLAFQLLGLVGILAGVVALWHNGITAATGSRPRHWRLVLIAALGVGMLLAASQFSIAFMPGYAFDNGEGEGTAVGFPFLVVYFDSAGRDYPALSGVCMNAVFWFMAPQIFIALYAWRRARRSES